MRIKMLRAELHNHSREDPFDWRGPRKVRYSAKELIDYASKQGTRVISITLHDKVLFNKELKEYGKRKGVLLIPGVELWKTGVHTLVWGIDEKERKTLKSLSDLERVKDSAVVCAAHPFYSYHSIGPRLRLYKDSIHAIEYSHAYTRGTGMLNRIAKREARILGKTLIGTSDTHFLEEMGYTHAMLDCELNTDDVLEALRKPSRVKLVTRPLPFKMAAFVAKAHILDGISHSKRGLR
jgi:predicted metal-dependent phosphoesterase TrpH